MGTVWITFKETQTSDDDADEDADEDDGDDPMLYNVITYTCWY